MLSSMMIMVKNGINANYFAITEAVKWHRHGIIWDSNIFGVWLLKFLKIIILLNKLWHKFLVKTKIFSRWGVPSFHNKNENLSAVEISGLWYKTN
jgi:hypothetical protein